MPRYATDTKVSVEKSRAEIETILSRYGASHFGYMTGPEGAAIEFLAHNRRIRFVLPLPSKDADEFKRTPARGHRRSPELAYSAWEQACRQRWRALCLCIKAKLEAVDAEISEFESEFLANIVDPGTGRTIAEEIVPLIEARYDESVSEKPSLFLPAPKA